MKKNPKMKAKEVVCETYASYPCVLYCIKGVSTYFTYS